jgi:hypothetical protein
MNLVIFNAEGILVSDYQMEILRIFFSFNAIGGYNFLSRFHDEPVWG